MTGEFAAIAAIRSGLPEPADPRQLWIGDDAAILPAPPGEWLLFAADTVVAGVHADLTLTSLADLGWKALMAAVSDLAAMGADPGYAVVTVAGPASTDLEQLYDGLGPAAAACGCPIVGGDLANAPELVVTVAVTGSCPGEPVRRSGAQPGDGVWVTGPLGAAAAGLRRYRARAAGEPGADRDPELRRAHARPTANLAGGRAARLVGARAMIDISDGLTADLGHLAAASGIGMQLDRVPVADGATLEEALGGGEDFALAFCTPEEAAVGDAFAGLPAPARIGTCTTDAGRLVLNGRPLEPTGWEHQW
ncbi:MAG TPA: thiamine-phosphate kinase [Acidimicrobiales bacterium]